MVREGVGNVSHFRTIFSICRLHNLGTKLKRLSCSWSYLETLHVLSMTWIPLKKGQPQPCRDGLSGREQVGPQVECRVKSQVNTKSHINTCKVMTINNMSQGKTHKSQIKADMSKVKSNSIISFFEPSNGSLPILHKRNKIKTLNCEWSDWTWQVIFDFVRSALMCVPGGVVLWKSEALVKQ